MDLGPQIYLSNNNKILVKNDFCTTISKKIPGKFFFNKNLGKKIEKKVCKNNFGNFFFNFK